MKRFALILILLALALPFLLVLSPPSMAQIIVATARPADDETADARATAAVVGTPFVSAIDATTIPPPQFATDDTFALVWVNRANLRTGPDLNSRVARIARSGERYQIAGLYYPGESTVLDPDSPQGNEYIFDDPGEREVWYLLDLGGGNAAWIFGGLVIVANAETLDALLVNELTAEQEASIDAQLAFAANTIGLRYTSRLRSGPGTDSSQIGILQYPSRVSLIGRNSLGTWYLVNQGGQQGWVNFSVLALPQGFDPTTVPIVP